MPPIDSITIVYGSDTGNAEDYARYLAKRLTCHGLRPTVSSGNDYPMKQLITKTRYLIVVCSTAGQGDLPANIRQFFRFLLKKKLPPDLLNHVNLTSFGIGDSTYSKYNYAMKKIHTRLLQLGCTEFSPKCEADEQSAEGVDGFYREWELELIETLSKSFTLVYNENNDLLLTNRLVCSETNKEVFSPGDLSTTRLVPNMKIGKIVQNERVTAQDHFQDIRHVIIESEDLEYDPGDSLALYPINDDRSVQLLLELQPHWLPYSDKLVEISGEYHLDGGIIDRKQLTLRNLIKYHLDIMSIPRRTLFMTLWHFVNTDTEMGEREQQKLKEFGSLDDPEELYDYANRPRRLILEMIMEFENNLRIPLEYIFDIFPKIKPRLFSIASKPDPHRVELVVGVVEYKTMLRRIRRGLCTKWLKTLGPGDEFVFTIDRNRLNFELPNVANPPLIMVAPGTGIAPMKSLVEDIVQLNRNQQMYLFYGCRYKAKDYLFEREWNNYVNQKKLQIFPTFSRESKVKYVQDQLYQHRTLVGDLILNQNAIVYVCGSAGSMPKQVKITLAEIVKEEGNLTEEEAHTYIFNMENTARYKEDTW